MAADSLRKRYFAKLIANSFGLAIALVTEAIIPRGLGPKAYGDFFFLSDFFNRIVGFLDMGTSTGFYTKLSQRQEDFGLVAFYVSFVGLVSFLVFIIVVCMHVTGIYATLLPGQYPFYIYLAAVWGILTWLVQVLNKIADAYGVTVSAETARILQKGLGLVLILALFLTSYMNLASLFYYYFCILVFLALAFIWVMEHNGHSLRRSWRLSWSRIKAYTKELYDYSHPLFILSLVGLIVGFLERWMLQMYGGSVEQGFYGLSYKIGVVCFLFTGAMTPLITREFAIAFKDNNIHEMARLFRRYIPMLYSISAYFGCFISVQASKVTYIMGGDKFHQATLAVMIMAFYPIHQTYGQLSGSVFMATGQTGMYRNIAIAFSLIGLPLTYFLIAPGDKMGLDLGASGLAIKMVALQLVAVNVQLYLNARLLGLKFWRYVGHQVASMSAFLTLALLAGLAVDSVLRISDIVIVNFVSSGIVYSILVAGLLMVFPTIFGLNGDDMRSLKRVVFH